MTATSKLPGSGTFRQGIHPPEHKELAAESPVEVMPTPAAVRIPLLQHLGASCTATVKARDHVGMGDLIGQAEGFVSAAVHTSVSGTVGRVGSATLPNGRHVPVIPIDADEEQPLAGRELYDALLGGEWPIDEVGEYDAKQIATAAREAGLVGLGGAAFPTHVKLSTNPNKPIDTLLVNGCECEPYLTSDYRMMVEAPSAVIVGALLAAKAIGAQQIIVGVEDNKPTAVQTLQEAAQGTNVEVIALHTKYPQGGEKQLVVATLGREVPMGGLPLDVGVVVTNVGTAASLAGAVMRGAPLTHRIVSVSGKGIKTPKNLLVAIGTSYRELIDLCGGLTDEAVRVVAGGPMMGFTLGNLDTPVTKGTSGITVLTEEEIRRTPETNCLRCGRCVECCPMRLVPQRLALAARSKNPELADKYHIAACMECGCCSYICPAGLPLVQLIRLGKVMAR